MFSEEMSDMTSKKSESTKASAKSELIYEVSAKTKADSWTVELVATVFCTAALAGLVIGLSRIDGHPTSTWPLKITPNACISIIMTCLDAGLLFVVASCLGQLKWINYTRAPRSLTEMQMFDDASRRSINGVFRILSGKGGFFAMFGIFVSLLTYLVAPVAQQVLKFPLHSTPGGQAVVYRAVSFSEGGDSSVHNPVASLPMRGNVYDALFSYSSNEAMKNLPTTCPSGNCTWDPFLTLGVRSDCVDITHLIKTNDTCTTGAADCLYYLPSPYDVSIITNNANSAFAEFTAYIGLMNSTVALRTSEPNAPIVQFAMMNSTSTSQTSSYDYTAFDCTVRWCAQNVSTKVTNGVFQQNVSLLPFDLPVSVNASSNNDLDNIYALPVPGEDPFIISNLANAALYNLLRLFGGNYTITNLANQDDYTFSSDVMQALWSSGNVSSLMESVATGITNRVRTVGTSFMWANGTNVPNIEPVLGTNWIMVSKFAIGWEWMAVPFCVLLLTWVFLLITMYRSRRHSAGIWKTSLYPLLFHGLCDQSKMDVSKYEMLDEMEKKAQAIAVQLRETTGGPRLLVHDPEHSERLTKARTFSIVRSSSMGKDFLRPRYNRTVSEDV